MTFKKEISKVYATLKSLNLLGTIDRIKYLTTADPDELDSDRPLRIESIICFSNFCKYKYFLKESFLAVTYNGYLCGDWDFKDDGFVSIIFKNDNQVEYVFYNQKTRLSIDSSIFELIVNLKRYGIPRN